MRHVFTDQAGGMLVLLLILFPNGCSRRDDSPIMSYKEYSALKISTPYIVRSVNTPCALFYFGAEHSACPQHPQMAQIEEAWSAFKPDIAFSEGGVWPLMPTRDEAICNYGEGGLLRYLAARDSVPIYSLEPSRVEEVLKLRREFEPETIKLFYTLRQVAQYRRGQTNEDINKYTFEVLQILSKVAGLEGSPRNLAELESSCQYRVPALKDWRQAPADWFNPMIEGSDFNRISRALGRIRDKHMIKLLAEETRQGCRVFAIAGYSHVVMQERALRRELGDEIKN